ncbi:MAG: hypothetical protein GC138_10080 [Gammaproteobacteria bacterium]|nr:hypothetical protein [Gammaproteobacteria bacterium]
MKPFSTLFRITALLLAAVLIQEPSQAKEGEIYRGRAPDGSVIFSDQPLPGAESVEIRTPQTIPALQTTPDESPVDEGKTKGEEPGPYIELKIVSPGDDEALRENAGRVVVSYACTPPLDTKNGHYLRIQLDGKPVEVPNGKMSVTLSNVDRGSHELVGEILSYAGDVLIASPKTVFHLQRYSALFKKNPTN